VRAGTAIHNIAGCLATACGEMLRGKIGIDMLAAERAVPRLLPDQP